MHDPLLLARLTTPYGLREEEIARWEQLCCTVPALSSPFLSVHYARAVATSGVDVRVCVIARAGEPCGFLPYQMTGRIAGWLGSAEPIGAAMTDYFGLIAEPDLRIDSGQLLQLAGLNYLNFSHLDESQLAHGLPGEKPRTGLRVMLDHESDHPLESLLATRRKYRNDTERRVRQLANEVGPLEFVLDVEHGRDEALRQLVIHKRAQYQRTGAPDALADLWKTRLLDELSTYRFDSCRSLLSTVSAGGQWLAMHFGIVGNGVLQYWLPVYNPEYSKFAPGRLLIHQIIESSRDAGIRIIDRGEGDSPSKRELANEEHRFLRGVWQNKTVASGLMSGLNSIKWRLSAR